MAIEWGLQGGEDPENRGPMRWDREPDPYLRQLIQLRNELPALRVGDWLPLDADGVLVFARNTDRWEDLAILLANPESSSQTVFFTIPDYRLMSQSSLVDRWSGEKYEIQAGTCQLRLKGHEKLVLQVEKFGGTYSPYKRV